VLRVQDSQASLGLEVSGFEFRISGPGSSNFHNLGFRVQGECLEFMAVGFRGLGFRVSGSGMEDL